MDLLDDGNICKPLSMNSAIAIVRETTLPTSYAGFQTHRVEFEVVLALLLHSFGISSSWSPRFALTYPCKELFPTSNDQWIGKDISLPSSLSTCVLQALSFEHLLEQHTLQVLESHHQRLPKTLWTFLSMFQ